MLHIKYKLDRSTQHGIGLFADQDIPIGMVIYTASPKLDLNITAETFELLAQKEKDEILYWGFWMESDQVWHVDFDMTKFINHSFEGNVTQDPEQKDAFLIACCDIKKGAELTQNYLEFEKMEDLKRRGILLA